MAANKKATVYKYDETNHKIPFAPSFPGSGSPAYHSMQTGRNHFFQKWRISISYMHPHVSYIPRFTGRISPSRILFSNIG